VTVPAMRGSFASPLCKTGVLAVAGLAVLGCGSKDSGEASAGGVSLKPPRGWQVEDRGVQGLVLAPQKSDLSPAVAVGPRFTARPSGGDLPNARELVRSGPAGGAKAIGRPRRTRVGGHEAVAIQVRERRMVSGWVAVTLGSRRGYSFLLEAPADQWPQSQSTLSGILSTVKFDVGEVPEATGELP
jgi:hypothetical protein